MTIPEDLLDQIKAAFTEDGLEEVVLRVSRYSKLSEAMNEPAAYQALLKYQGQLGRSWGVGIRGCPIAALRAALESPTTSPAPKDIEDIFA